MSKIKVSIIVPVYNVEKYIDKCLNSLVNQTLEEIEIIVVNDGSPDNSKKIIDKYVKKYPNKIKSFITENGGQGSARNYGLTKSKGEYIGYVDSDDYIELDMYEKMYKTARKENSDVVICGCNCVYENNDNREVSFDRKILDDNKNNAFFGKTAVWNKIYKRDIIVNNNLQFRSRVWYEDFDFTLSVLSKANKVDYINEPLYNYLIREGSTMNNTNIERNLEILLAFDEINKNCDIDKDILEYLAIEHILIAASGRIMNIKSSYKKQREAINQLLDYVNKNYKDYKHNKYKYIMSRGQNIIFFLVNIRQYYLISVLFSLVKVKDRVKKCLKK